MYKLRQKSKTKSHPIIPFCLQLPFQAIKCSLVDIGPVTEEWEEEAESDALWEMGHDGDDNRTLTLKVGFEYFTQKIVR